MDISWSFRKMGKKERIPGIINNNVVHFIFEQTPFMLKITKNRTVAMSIVIEITSQANRLFEMMCPIKKGWTKRTLWSISRKASSC